MPQPESKLKKRFDDAFDKLFPPDRGYHTAIEKGRGQKSGLPDRFYTASNGHCWVEFKVSPNKLSPIQKLACERLGRSGSRVVVVTLMQPPTSVLVQQVTAFGGWGHTVETALDDVTTEAFWRFLLQVNSRCCSYP